MFNPTDLLTTLPAETLKASNAAFSQALQGFEKLTALNLDAARSSFATGATNAKALIAAKDPQAAADLFAGFVKPGNDAVAAYAKEVYEIAAETSASLFALGKSQVSKGSEQALAAVESLAKNAPAGSEGAVKFLRDGVQGATVAAEQAFNATEQMIQLGEKSLRAGVAPKAKKAA
jgi:phasin family protein